MKLLFLAPQPFFQERGTPIAVRLALQVLTARIARQGSTGNQDTIDLVTYREGADISIPGVKLIRIPSPRWLKGVGPGISFKKLCCDLIFTATVLKLAWQNRKAQYDLVHAVEESVFVALLLKLLFSIPYIYDMDSSLALQLTEKWFLLKPLTPLLSLLEKLAVKHSVAVVPVCDALAVIARRHGSKYTSVLNDISLLNTTEESNGFDLRSALGIASDAQLIVYIGNLEPYQGIDLLIESFSLAAQKYLAAHLVIIGGRAAHIKACIARAQTLGMGERVHLIGPRPVSELDTYILQADILASPRIRGNNTPMKVYSYLHSGRAIVATRLPTHTQVLDDSMARLADPDPVNFSAALLELLNSRELRVNLGSKARALALERYTFSTFSERLNAIYDTVSSSLAESAVTKGSYRRASGL